MSRRNDGQRFAGFANPSMQPESWKAMWDEWHGYGEFHNIPCRGGFNSLETIRGTGWRRDHIGVKGAKRHFSRFKSIITAAKEFLSSSSMEEMMATFTKHFDEAAAGKAVSLANVVKVLQRENIMEKRERNDKKRTAREAALDDLLQL